jgi:glycerate dehydrogenase
VSRCGSQEINDQLKDTDCLLVNPFAFEVKKEHIDLAPELKYISVLATAYGKVDCEYAKTKNITVCNIPSYSTEAVAELAFGVILEHIRPDFRTLIIFRQKTPNLV